jgi:TRAP transporter TAXI family solute receptor
MRIGTAEASSTFLAQGEALRSLLADRGMPGPIEVVLSPAASIDNANRLEAGDIDYGFMAANWIGRARIGIAPFKSPIELRLVAPMNAGPLFFIVRADSHLRSVADLKGRRLAPGLAASGMTQHAHTILGALGISLADCDVRYLDFASGAEALARGEIDAQLQCPIPNKIMTDLDQRIDLRVLPYAPGQLETVLSHVPFYRRVTMRKDALRALQSDVDQPGVVNVLVTHARRPAPEVEQVTRAILGGAAELARACSLYEGMSALFEPLRTEGATALQFGGVPLHDGALAAYRAAGYIV